jgi:hypothetical protein
MPPLVTDMGDPKKPWEDVPIEVLIEYERKKREELEKQREQLRIPLYSPMPHNPRQTPNDNTEEEYKIVINFS